MSQNRARIKEKTAGNTRKRSNKHAQRNHLFPRRIIWGGLGVLLGIAILISAIVLLRSQTGPSSTIAGVTSYANLKRDHQTGPIAYPQTPPVGGPHHPLWQNCGMYTSPVPNENAVHALEHSAVWITYQPTVGEQETEQLKNLARGQSYMLLSPYPGLPAPIVITAWGAQLHMAGLWSLPDSPEELKKESHFC